MTRFVAPLLAIALVLTSAATLAFFMQRAVLFPIPRLSRQVESRSAEAVALPTGAGLFLRSRGGPTPRPAILFAHGNAETAADWLESFEALRDAGWHVLLLEYPGYAGTAGSPSETSIVAAAMAGYDWLRANPDVDSTRIVAYGRSLGSGAVTPVAANRQVAGLVLESGLTSTYPLAAKFLVPRILVRDPLDNLALLARYRGPLLVVHGRNDEVIPFSHGEALAAATPGSTFVALDCGHNDCPRPWATFRTWASQHNIAAP